MLRYIETNYVLLIIAAAVLYVIGHHWPIGII